MRMPSHGRMIFCPGDQLLADFVGEIDRDGETEPAIHAIDQRVHADDTAVDIAKRAAAVAGIDRGVGLDEIGNRVTGGAEQIAPAFPADHAASEGVIELEGRADGEGEFAYAQFVAVAHLHRGQIVRVDLDHGHVGFFIGADELGLKLAPVFQLHVDAIGTLDHVIVGEDVAVRFDDESRAFVLHRLAVALTAVRIFVGLLIEEEIVEG